MSTTAPVPSAIPFVPNAPARILSALRRLEAGYHPHPCGGFNSDDVGLASGLPFFSDEVQDTLLQLTDAGLVRIAGHDENAAFETCFSTV